MRSLVILLLIPAASIAADPVGPPAQITRVSTAADAVVAVEKDQAQLDPVSRLFTRYIWTPQATKADRQAIALTLNYISRATTVYKPAVIAGGELMRVDLRRLAPRTDDGVNDLQEYLETWEELRFSPEFNKLITVTTIKNLIIGGAAFPQVLEVGSAKIRVKCRPYSDGSDRFDSRWVSVARFIPDHLDAKAIAAIEVAAGSEAPIVHYQYFLTRALTSVRGKGVFRDVLGGLYYQFVGIKTSNKKGVTDQDLLFTRLFGATAAKIFDERRSDQKVLTRHSNVTGHKRVTEILPALVTKPNIGQSVAMVTHDLAETDAEDDQDPFANLLDFKDTAREIYFPNAIGLQVGVLFDGDGKLQEAAPSAVVGDTTIPNPYSKDLQAMISCIRCHGDSDGWKPLTNDVPALIKFGLEIKADFGSKKLKSQADILDRIAGQYAGTPEKEKAVAKVLRRAREDNLDAILAVTSAWDEAKLPTDIGKLSAGRISDLFADYNYRRIDAGRALLEMGYRVEGKAGDVFRELVPPDVRSAVAGVGIIEDYRIGLIRSDRDVSRIDWALIQGHATDRARLQRRK